MIDNIFDILLKLMPYWQVVLLLLGWAAMHFFYTKIRPLEEQQKKHEKTLGQLTEQNQIQGSAIDKIRPLEERQKKHEDALGRLTEQNHIQGNAIDKIAAFLGVKYKNFVDIYGMKKSPRQLSPTGVDLFNELKGGEFLEVHKKDLFERIDLHKPATAYDVENAAFYACMGASNTPIFNEYKLFVYNAPLRTILDKDGKEKRHEVTLDEVCFVLSIPLRDMYLAEHPEVLR